jgi:long-chain acyl-CoA synthetase
MEVATKFAKNIPATFMEIAQKRGERIAMRHKDFGLWQDISWRAYYQQSAYLAHALIQLGVAPGDFVGIIGENDPKWLFMDMGIQMAGARTVGIYTTNAPPQIEYILNHSKCTVLFAENEEQVDKWLQIKSNLPSLKYVIYWDKKGLERMDDPQLLFYDEVIARGEKSFEDNPRLHHSRIEKVQPDDIAFLVYTSGTTGQPKGAMLNAKNVFWVAESLKNSSSDMLKYNDHTMSFLPLCHIFERMFSVYFPMVVDYVIHFAEGTDTIAQNIREIRPTVGYAVPRVWEKFQSSIFIKMGDAPWINRQLFQLAIKIGSRYTKQKLANKPIGPGLRISRFFAYWTILYPLKYMIGMNKMRFGLSGAAPISPKVLEFYHMLGITLLEAYGMTETAALISISTATDFKLGTVGKPLEGVEVKLAEDGEILVRHPGVITGYYKNPEATANALKEGWLHTGDVGIFDSDGFLQIIDRKKDLIITAGGKNIAPQKIESKLKVSIYINDAIVIGDKRKFISAIIVLDEENINKYARDKKIQYSAYSDLASHPEIKKLINSEVDKVNMHLARVESIRKFTILDKRLYVEDGEVTPTMKVKRTFINNQYRDLIERMYH